MERCQVIANLNDKLRINGEGGDVLVTRTINEMQTELQQKIISAVRNFNDFTEDNDPYKEHDFGSVDVEGNKIFWKIDYYDESMKFASEDPTDPDITKRVMTIMLASEY